MQRISRCVVIDIIDYDDHAVVFVEKRPLAENPAKYRANYLVYDFDKQQVEQITKSAYLLKKFGPEFNKISAQVRNFVSCDAAILYDKRVLMIYPNGEAGIFDRDGELGWTGSFAYHEETVSGLALEGKYFWCVCKNENCIIRYSAQNMKVDLRIGGKNAVTFQAPEHISCADGDLYVCCNTNKVKRIDGTNYGVEDYLESKEHILRFKKHGKNAIICTPYGAYAV